MACLLGGLIATIAGNFVKMWDVIGGGKLFYSMKSHNKITTSLLRGLILEGWVVASVCGYFWASYWSWAFDFFCTSVNKLMPLSHLASI